MAAPLSAEAIAATKAALANNRTKRQAAKELGISTKGLDLRLQTIERRSFTVPELPSSEVPLDELLDRRRADSGRKIVADAARDLVQVKINVSGPYGLMLFGDPHIDDPGCDFARLERHIGLAAKRPGYVLPGNIGDLQNNWIGRLARLHAEQSTTTRDAWRLVEWMMHSLDWLFLVDGNHDVWSGSGNPLDWIVRGAVAYRQPHGVRLALNHPNGKTVRLHARHNFKGSSIYHDLHGLKRETFFGQRDHIIVAGHLHSGGDEGTVTPDGTVAQLIRLSGYKVVDDYARQGQFTRKAIHPSALIIIDPDKPETERDHVWCAPTIEAGIEYLDWLRARYEGTARVVVKTR